MSQKKLQQFLKKLDSELKRDSDDYRRGTTNRKYTTFTYKSSTIRKVIRVLLNNASNLDGPNSTAQVAAAVKKLTPLLRTLTESLRRNFQSLAARSKDGSIVYRSIRGGLVVIAKEQDNRDNFNLVQRAYKKELDIFYNEFLKALQSDIIRPSNTSESKTVNVGTAGQAFNLEHLKGKSNIQDFMNNSIFNALQEAYSEGPPVDIFKELESLGFTNLLKIIKNAENGTVELFLGSQILNALESKKERALKVNLEKKLAKAIEKLGGIQELEGSDSLATGVKKKYTKAITEPFKKVKGAKVKTEDTKIKEGAPSTLDKKVVVSKVASSRSLKKKKVASRAGAGSQVSNFRLLAAINTNLTEAIQKNMVSPALNYRSGRFAESVKLTDISVTQRGFPSIGYTYQKFPYQTFEVGGAQGTQARDPRKLIDRSIREVAAQLALGRFYTRRL